MTRNQWGMISLIGAIFILPVVAAWFLYFKAGDWQLATTNRGVLLQPPLTVAELRGENWRGKWILFYVDTHCADQCKQAMVDLAEINLVLGKESSRIRSVLATLPLSESADEPDTHMIQQTQQLNAQVEHLILTSASLRQLLAGDYLVDAENPHFRRALFVVDPLGNVILYYPVPFSTKAVYQDMKKLLKASQVG